MKFINKFQELEPCNEEGEFSTNAQQVMLLAKEIMTKGMIMIQKDSSDEEMPQYENLFGREWKHMGTCFAKCGNFRFVISVLGVQIRRDGGFSMFAAYITEFPKESNECHLYVRILGGRKFLDLVKSLSEYGIEKDYSKYKSSWEV